MPDSPARVLFVLPSFAGGGAERVALNLVGALKSANVSPELLILDGDGPLITLVPAEVPCTVLDIPRLRHAWRRIAGEIRHRRPDVVFSTLGYVNLALLALRPLLPSRTRIVIREANLPSLSLPSSGRPRLLGSAYRWLYRRADTVIATSGRMAEELRADYGVPASRILILPNPVDESAIRDVAIPIRRDAGYGVRLVAAGRLTRQKGFDLLIDTFSSINDSVSVAILGDGEERAALEARAARLGIAGRVTFPGFQANPWSWYAGADAFVMSSRWEGMPNAALEALACGTPVIATPESGGIAEVAGQVPAGSVTVAAMGKPFATALNAVTARQAPYDLRESLLPAEYRIEAVAEALRRLFGRP